MKSLRLKNLVAAALVAVTVATLSPVGASAEWKQDSKGWWNTEGNSYSIGWRSISGSWYYFNSDGYMKTGWVNDGGTWYYLQPSGAMKTGWVNDGGTWYYLQPSGAMKTGWINDNGTWYFASSTGAMQTGVVEVEGKVYYLAPSGAMATGNVTISGVTYTFAASGEAVGDKIPTSALSFLRDGSIATPNPTPTPEPSPSGSNNHSGGGSTSNTLAVSALSDGGTHSGDCTIYAADVANSNTFGASDKVTTINGNVSIADAGALGTDSITLKNITISGTLSINFGAGNVILENVTVNGVNVSNVGSNSLHVRGKSRIAKLQVNDNNGAHIVVEGDASIASTTVSSGVELEVDESATNSNPFASIILSPGSVNDQVAFKGDFSGAAVEARKESKVVLETSSTTLQSVTANSALTISGDGQVATVIVKKAGANVEIKVKSVGTVSVNAEATGAKIDIPTGTTVATLNISAKVDVTGAGKIVTANLGVSGITIEVKPVNIGVISGITVKVEGATVNDQTPGVTIIISVPTPGDTISDFQKDINSRYADYAKATIIKNKEASSEAKATFTVSFDMPVDSTVGGTKETDDYVTQDILVTNADGTDAAVTYSNGEYTAPIGSKVYSFARVYRNGQIGYVTTVQTVK